MKQSPFTTLCQLTARTATHLVADLHTHTTCSDGSETPAQVVNRARRAGLRALAITDHDTLAGYLQAIALPVVATPGWPTLEIVPGVEITCTFQKRELHLLAYGIQPHHPGLIAALDQLAEHRRERDREMRSRLRMYGIDVPDAPREGVLGRPHLARILVAAGKVTTVREAFTCWLRDGGPIAVPKLRLPVDEAIGLVRSAGGLPCWAHPPGDTQADDLKALHDLGLGGVEVAYPNARPGLAGRLREQAASLGMVVSGGSDWHGPSPRAVPLGTRGVTADEWAALRSTWEKLS